MHCALACTPLKWAIWDHVAPCPPYTLAGVLWEAPGMMQGLPHSSLKAAKNVCNLLNSVELPV